MKSGDTLGPYRLVAELGAGGMGCVWRAEVLRPTAGLEQGASVALKVIHPHLFEGEGFFKRFLLEAEIGRRVLHENVVRTYDADAIAVDGRQAHFLVMEYVAGKTLRALIAELGKASESLCRHVAREIARGLAAIHAVGAVHRDLKPENVLVTPDHVVKVMDLGVARLAERAIRLSESGLFLGSLPYAAPEQLHAAGSIDARADLYALGVLLYEMATGTHPYGSDDPRVLVRRILEEEPPRLGERDSQSSPFLEEFVHALLEKDPGRRPPTAGDCARILDEGERSSWWLDRARSVRARSGKPKRPARVLRETALYGREAESQRLDALWERVMRGEGQVVILEGEAGIGKSRLVEEFVSRLSDAGRPFHALFGSYPPAGAATAAGAFATAYREHFGAEAPEQGPDGCFASAPHLARAFAALLRGDTPPPGAEPWTRDSLQGCFVRATHGIAAERPTVVGIDDLHFAPQEGRALFAALAHAVPGHRVFLLGTTRPDVDSRWLAGLSRLDHVTRIPLPRLGPADLVRLLDDAFGSARLADDLGSRIALKSDGNPFFVFEILRGLRENGSLVRGDDGSWHTTGALREIRIPSTVVDQIRARLLDLEPEDKALLDVAACCGFEFDPRLVANALGTAPIPVLQRLARIEMAHRLVRSVGARFVFDHHQVQEALYEGLPGALREEYHAAIAGALEAKVAAAEGGSGPVEGALAAELAEHALKGRRWDLGMRHVDAALDHLERRYFTEGALRLVDAVLGGAGALSSGQRLAYLARRGDFLEIMGRWEEEGRVREEAVALADADGAAAVRVRTRSALATHRHRTGRLHEARGLLLEALNSAPAEGADWGDVGVLLRLGNVNVDLGRYGEARDAYERALARARETSNVQGEATAMGNMGVLLHDEGRYEEAREHHARHLSLAIALADRRGEARAMSNLGRVEWAAGRYAQALRSYDRHLALVRAIGDRRGEGQAIGGRACCLRMLGNSTEARDALTTVETLARAMGNADTEDWATQERAMMWNDEGDFSEAERLLAGVVERRRARGALVDLSNGLLALGGARLERGAVENAGEPLREAARLAAEIGSVGVATLAAAWLALTPEGDASDAARRVEEQSSRMQVCDAMEARWVLYRATGRVAHLAEAKRILDQVLSTTPEDRRGPLLEAVRLHREVARLSAAEGL